MRHYCDAVVDCCASNILVGRGAELVSCHPLGLYARFTKHTTTQCGHLTITTTQYGHLTVTTTQYGHLTIYQH